MGEEPLLVVLVPHGDVLVDGGANASGVIALIVNLRLPSLRGALVIRATLLTTSIDWKSEYRKGASQQMRCIPHEISPRVPDPTDLMRAESFRTAHPTSLNMVTSSTTSGH